MSASTKAPQSIRHGGPGSSHENARKSPGIRKPPADDETRQVRVSGGGGERDSHRLHDPARKGGGPARSPLQDDP